MISQRASDRRPLQTPALLTLEDDKIVPCMTINISSGGVKLVFPKDAVLPGDFRVTVPAARIRNRRARMVWRTGDELGVRFV